MKGKFIERKLSNKRVFRIEIDNDNTFALCYVENINEPIPLTLTDEIKKAFRKEDWVYFNLLIKEREEIPF